MDKEEAWKKINEALQEQARISYVADFVENTDATQVAAEALGLVLAEQFGWDGEQVALFLLSALYSGLEDANWHTECGVFYDWRNKMQNGALLGDVIGGWRMITDEPHTWPQDGVMILIAEKRNSGSFSLSVQSRVAARELPQDQLTPGNDNMGPHITAMGFTEGLYWKPIEVPRF